MTLEDIFQAIQKLTNSVTVLMKKIDSVASNASDDSKKISYLVGEVQRLKLIINKGGR